MGLGWDLGVDMDLSAGMGMGSNKDEKFCLPIKRGRERLVNIKKNNLMNTWKYHSINGILRKKRKQTITLFPIEPMQYELHWTKKSKQ